MMKLPHFYSQFTLTALALGLAVPAFGQEPRAEDSPERVTLNKSADGRVLSAKFQSPEYSAERILHDSDGDGWCDLWFSLFKNEITHRSKRADTDGDGLTDYEEMVLMRNPLVAGPMPRQLTEADIARNEEVAKEHAEEMKKIYAERKQAFTPFVIQSGEEKALAKAKKSQALAAISARMRGNKVAQEAAIQEAARVLNIPKRGQDQNGRNYALESFDGSTIDMKKGFNFRAADTISTDEILPNIVGLPGGSTGLNLTGAGQVIGIWDEADVFNHVELNGRITDIDGTSGTNLHATHVAGTMSASGVQTAARGMSPASQLAAADFVDDLIEIPIEVTSGLNLSNHSYGLRRGWELQNGIWVWWGETTVSQTEDYRFGFYSDFSRFVDEVAYEAKTYLPVWAAGNERGSQGPLGAVTHFALENGDFESFTGSRPRDQSQATNPGYDLISDYSVAKNTLTVAATEDVVGGYTSANGVIMSSFSSFGPVDDGRIKPDISGNGVNVASTTNTGSYGNLSGTSMATPSITGSINLLREHWENTLENSADVWGSTWKGLVIHTADETGTSTGPDYRFGWGLMNSESSADIITDQNADRDSLPHIKEVRLESGDFIEFRVQATGGQPLKVTLCWTDPEGTVPPAALDANIPALVNDLDLRIMDGPTEHFPWRLNPNNPTAPATRNGDNDRDNVEQVLIDSPTSGGKYIVRVTHKGNLVDDAGMTSSQDVSLILSGVTAQEAPPLQISEIVQSGTNEFTAFWQTVVGDRYTAESSTDLQIWTQEATDISPTKELSAVVLPTGGATKKFWRLRRTE